ncbi:cupin domain-containing protein [Clostridium sp. CTA-7]
MKNAEYYIESLNMTSHVEGGYFKESFLSNDEVRKDKKLWSSIYFLLKTGEVSNFHRLKSDEVWYYHDGEALTIYMISPEGELIAKQLGINIENGEVPQVLVPKGYIFGSAMNNDGFALVGCMVAPAFEFDDFELFEREELLKLYPEHKETILKLTRETNNN